MAVIRGLCSRYPDGNEQADKAMGRIHRRQFIRVSGVALGLGLLAPFESIAQSANKMPVIGMLDAGERLKWWAAFRERLRELGYVEGKNVSFEARYAKAEPERLPALAQDLVRRNVTVIVTAGLVAALSAKRATSTIPIVMGTGADHVSLGLAVSLARPGRNITGMSSISSELTGKRLELLRELIPKLSRLAVLWQSDNLGSAASIRELESDTRSLRVELQNLGVGTTKDLEEAFAAATRERAQAIFVVGGPFLSDERQKVVDLALKHRLPSMYTGSQSVELGGLLSYGPNYPDLFRRAAVYVDKILRGAKPGDLPIEQPTKFDLVLNRKTANALGLTIPQSILLRADRVIEK